MLNDRPLQIEVLVNSPGPHDQVRIREPFMALQALGVDCRIHERPFRFNDCIRPYSLVIWQRPLPESQQRQWEHLQWLRQRGCLLLTEWDDHPELLPASVRQQLADQAMAPPRLCHGFTRKVGPSTAKGEPTEIGARKRDCRHPRPADG